MAKAETFINQSVYHLKSSINRDGVHFPNNLSANMTTTLSTNFKKEKKGGGEWLQKFCNSCTVLFTSSDSLTRFKRVQPHDWM